MSSTAASQRTSILNHVRNVGPLSTLHAREFLGVMHPAARVMELRKRGEPIVTHWRTETDVTGTRHRVAEYVYLPSKSSTCQEGQSR